MATTSAFGSISQVPFGLIRNIRQLGLERVSVLVFDSGNKLRQQYISETELKKGVPFYEGDTVKILFGKGCQGAAQVCDIITVVPATGAESVASTKWTSAPLQKAMVIACSAIHASTGVATVAVTYEVV